MVRNQKFFVIPGLFGVKWNCSDPTYGRASPPPRIAAQLSKCNPRPDVDSFCPIVFDHPQDCPKRFNNSRWPFTANPAPQVSPTVQEQEVGLVAKLDGYAQVRKTHFV